MNHHYDMQIQSLIMKVLWYMVYLVLTLSAHIFTLVAMGKNVKQHIFSRTKNGKLGFQTKKISPRDF